ncbi:unnamed protein product [Oikopleura dioica]|uniref:Sulfotransferase n=1 Tax=Oikopleura dioica TaxID=34765 RepID=E4Y4B0_OIKDI|nr:unnamed protein product [Oikopleura dioica]
MIGKVYQRIILLGALVFLSFIGVYTFDASLKTTAHKLHKRDYREEISINTPFIVPKLHQPACLKPVDDIVFVKTHKTGSSTLQNIFRRYGLKNNLEIAMPVNDGNRFEYPYFFKSTFMKQNQFNLKPKIIANHLRASPELYETFPNAKRITILRDIPSLYESSFSYFRGFSRPYRNAKSLEIFFASPKRFFNSAEPYGNKGNDIFARNHMAFDLGMPWLSENNEENILKALEQTFHLVLITDYFPESMVLLKNELCWEWDDVVFFVTNQRSEKAPLSQEIELQMKKWNSLDNAIFNHFNATFWRKIENCENFEEDLKVLNIKLEEVKKTCLKENFKCAENDPDCSKTEDYFDVKIKKFELSEGGKKLELCRLMVMTELEMTGKIYQKQWPGWYELYDGRV